MTWHDEPENVRVIQTGNAAPNLIYGNTVTPSRTEAQKHTDTALDNADLTGMEAGVLIERSLEWAASVGVEIPSRVRGVVTIWKQWQTHLEDERKRRG